MMGKRYLTIIVALLLAGPVAATVPFTSYLKVTAKDTTYYRPHERFAFMDEAWGTVRYPGNVQVRMSAPHGNLRFMDSRITPVPRELEFITDPLGFRNREAYHGQPYALLGDSFIVGSGLTQADLMSEALQAIGVDNYNMAYPAPATWLYPKYVAQLDRTTDARPRLLLFLFEGNDFLEAPAQGQPLPPVLPAPEKDRWLERYLAPFAQKGLYQFTLARLQSAKHRKGSAGGRSGEVAIGQVANHQLAFYKPYMREAIRTRYRPDPRMGGLWTELGDRIDHIFFIPTKFRVYYPFIDAMEGVPSTGHPRLPTVTWSYSQQVALLHGIPITDLTSPLRHAAKAALTEGRLIYWTDDTHWNREGIRVAAQVVAQALQSTRSPAR